MMRGLLALVTLLAAPPAEPPRHAYSPFGVAITSPGLAFDALSIKRVGRPEGADERFLEALADGLAQALASHRIPARFVHRADFADPEWHRQCVGRHAYVDVWYSPGPPRVGFSLWGGCGAEDRLGGAEVLLESPTLESDQAVQVAEAIARRLLER